MAKQTVNIGTTANDRTGDNLRTAFNKINANFTELYTALGLDELPLNLGAFEFTGSTITTTDSSGITVAQATTITSDLTVSGDVVPNTANGGDLGSLAKPWRSLYVSSSTVYFGGVPLSLEAGTNELKINNVPISQTLTYADIPNAPTDIGDLTDTGNLLGGSGADIGDITFANSTVTAGNEDEIIVQAKDTNGFATARLNLEPVYGNAQLSAYSEETTETFTQANGDFATGVWQDNGFGNGVVSFTGAQNIGDFFQNTLLGLTAANVSITINSEPAITWNSGVSGAGTDTPGFGTNPTVPPSPITITSIVFRYRSQSFVSVNQGSTEIRLTAQNAEIRMDADHRIQMSSDGQIGLQSGEDFTISSGRGINISTGSRDFINLSTGDFTVTAYDDINITGNDSFRIRNDSPTEPIQIITDNDETEQTWAFNPDGNLTLPGNLQSEGDISIEINLADSTRRIWRFGEDGDLRFPDSTVQTTAFTGTASSLVNGANTVSLGSDGTLTLPGSLAFPDDVGKINPSVSDGSGIQIEAEIDFEIKVFDSEDTAIWSFEPDGRIQFPDGSYQATAYTGSESGTVTGIESENDVSIRVNLTDSTTRVWRFGEDGDLAFPDGTVQTTAFTSMLSGIDSIGFDTSAGVSVTAGQLAWNSSDGTLDLGTGYADVVLQIGQETHYVVRNATGSTIPNGTAVYCSGVAGGSGRIEASPFLANNAVDSTFFLGLATHNINNGVNGVVTHFGYVRGLDTRGTANTSISVGDEDWSVGDKLYAHPTVAGKLTNVEPTLPDQKICVASIINRHQSVGVLFVRPSQHIPTNLSELTNDSGFLTAVTSIRNEGDVSIEINLTDSTTRVWRFGEDGNTDFPGTIDSPSIITQGIRGNEGTAEGNGNSLLVAAGSGSLSGGNLAIQAGIANSGTGGNIAVLAGTSQSGAGGNLSVSAGFAFNGQGGDVTISGGVAAGSAGSGRGGDTFIYGGTGGSAGDGGDIQIIAGSSSSYNGGTVVISSGSSSNQGGDLTLLGGAGSGGVGGDLIIEAGLGLSDPGDVIIRGGVGGEYRGDLIVEAGHVVIGSEGDINININLSDSTQRTWRFGEDGVLNVPGTIQLSSGALRFPNSTEQTTAYIANNVVQVSTTDAFSGDAITYNLGVYQFKMTSGHLQMRLIAPAGIVQNAWVSTVENINEIISGNNTGLLTLSDSIWTTVTGTPTAAGGDTIVATVVSTQEGKMYRVTAFRSFVSSSHMVSRETLRG